MLGCQLKEPQQNHGILFLENRSAKLQIDVTNQNDVIKTIGQPHSKSINDLNEWFFIERTLTKGEFHKLGKNILKESNILVLKFDKYGILKEKKLFDKNDISKVSFSKNTTENELAKKSFVENFLQSIKEKMYQGR